MDVKSIKHLNNKKIFNRYMDKIIIFGLIGIAIILIGTMGYLSYSDIEEHEDDYSVEIEGSEMKELTVQEVADLWEINSEALLSRIILEFDLNETYNIADNLEHIREEYPFSPAMIKEIAEEIKQESLQDE